MEHLKQKARIQTFIKETIVSLKKEERPCCSALLDKDETARKENPVI